MSYLFCKFCLLKPGLKSPVFNLESSFRLKNTEIFLSLGTTFSIDPITWSFRELFIFLSASRSLNLLLLVLFVRRGKFLVFIFDSCFLPELNSLFILRSGATIALRAFFLSFLVLRLYEPNFYSEAIVTLSYFSFWVPL